MRGSAASSFCAACNSLNRAFEIVEPGAGVADENEGFDVLGVELNRLERHGPGVLEFPGGHQVVRGSKMRFDVLWQEVSGTDIRLQGRAARFSCFSADLAKPEVGGAHSWVVLQGRPIFDCRLGQLSFFEVCLALLEMGVAQHLRVARTTHGQRHQHTRRGRGFAESFMGGRMVLRYEKKRAGTSSPRPCREPT